MSQVPSNKIGEARIDFVADTSQVDAGAAQAVAKVKAAGDQMQTQTAAATGAAGAGARGAAKEFKGAVSAVTSFIGRVLAVGAVASTFYNLGRAIREGVIYHLQTGTERAETFKAALDLSDVSGSIDAVSAKVESLSSRLDASLGGGFAKFLNDITGSTIEKLTAEKTQMERLLLSLRQAAGARQRSRRDQDEAKAEEKELGRLRESAANLERDLNRETMDDRQKAEEQFEHDAAKLKERRDKNVQRNPELDAEFDRIEAIYRRRRELAFANIEAEAAKMREEYRRAIRDAMLDVRADAVSMFGAGEVAVQIGQIRELLQTLSSQRRSLL